MYWLAPVYTLQEAFKKRKKPPVTSVTLFVSGSFGKHKNLNQQQHKEEKRSIGL